MSRLRSIRACSIALALTTTSFVALPTAAVTGWDAVGAATLGRDVIALAASPSRFVALTDASGLLYSDDGVAWQRPTTVVPTHHLSALAYGNGVFVGVGNGAVTSVDGISWTYARVMQSRFSALGFNGTRFVAAGAVAPTLMTSTDGVTWTAPSNAPTSLGSTASVTTGNGIVLVYGSGTTLMRSADGVTWQMLTVPVVGGHAFWDGAQFVFGGAAGPWYGSADGTTWSLLIGYTTEVPLAVAGLGAARFYLYDDRVDHGSGAANPGGGVSASGSEVLRAIAATSNAVVAAGESGAWYRYQDIAGWTQLGGATSVNGDEGPVASVELGGKLLAWTSGHGTPSGPIVGLGQKTFTPGHLLRSADGVVWDAPAVAAPPAPGADLGEMVVFGALIYTVSSDRLYSSSDGLSWTEVHQFPWPLATLASDGTTLVVAGATATEAGIASSTDAIAWSTFAYANAAATEFMPTQIVKSHLGWMAFVHGAGYWISADAISWANFTPLGMFDTGGASAEHGLIWQVQRGTGVARWTDNNVTWNGLTQFHLRFLEAPRWDGTRWLVVANDFNGAGNGAEHLPAVYESTDGTAWNIVRDSEFFDPRHVHVGAEGVFVLGAGGTVLLQSSHPALVAQVPHDLFVFPQIVAGAPRVDSLATITGAPVGATFHVVYDGQARGPVTLDETTGAYTVTNDSLAVGNGSFDYYVDYGGRQSNRGRISYAMATAVVVTHSGGGGGTVDPLLALVAAAAAALRARRRRTA
jgi:hypothetical protein